MKVKILYILSVVITAFVYLVLSSGCTATNKTLKGDPDITHVSDEVPKEVRITEFILGPGDKIEISVYRHNDLKKTIQIDTSGMITYPLVGDIQAAGLSVFQLRDKIREGLSKYLIDPQVSVSVTAVQSQKVIVLGEVNNPGLFTLSASLTTVEAISKAGGFTVDAKQRSILLIRGGLKNPELATLDLKKVLNEGDLTQNVYLQNGDIIYVPATFIANVSRFFEHLSKIISPIVSLESGYFIGQQIEGGQGGTAITPR